MERKNCPLLFIVGVLLDMTFHANGELPLDPDEYTILIQPSMLVVRYGDPVSVTCSVTKDHLGMGWEASEGSVGINAGIHSATWKLKNLTDWKIRPKCFVNFKTSAGPPIQQDKILNITVYKPPDSVLISVLNYKGPMLEGEQYRLQCDVLNIAPVQHLTVRWYKGKRELENKTLFNDASETPVNVSPTILITPTSADDGEQYSCVAELNLGPEGPQPPPSITSEPLNITVHYKPFFECPKHVLLGEGESLDTLSSCSAKGNPSPRVTWRRDQSEFSSSTPLTRRDGGRYILNAKNTYGTIGYALNVEVLYKPLISACQNIRNCVRANLWILWTPVQLKGTPLLRSHASHTLEIEVLYKPLITDCPKHVRLSEGQSLDTVVVCSARGNPTPIVVWYRSQSMYKSSTPLTRKDGGLYTFFAQNTLGTANHTLDVEILYKPRILKCPEHVTLKAGESLNTSVSCRADGNPLPVVTWYRNQSEFDSSTPLTERDGGQYIFMAKNSLGDITRTVNLTLSHPPNGRSACLKPVRFTLFIIISMINFFCM
ncbi:hypothetical protein GJAV_G00220310 [Gymnothorax javanicus]|nr:hypothetical protein GJAV_G00220310 [Gymnothorax javanicus]